MVADAPVTLRVRATLDGGPKEFNGAIVMKDDDVEILMTEEAEGTKFHFIKSGRKKGFIKADYIKEM